MIMFTESPPVSFSTRCVRKTLTTFSSGSKLLRSLMNLEFYLSFKGIVSEDHVFFLASAMNTFTWLLHKAFHEKYHIHIGRLGEFDKKKSTKTFGK